MKKLILSLTLMGALAIIPTISCMAKVDSPNDKVRFKNTSIEEVSETSMFVEDTITPKCKCDDEKCKDEKDKDKDKGKKEVCPSKVKEIEKDKDNKKTDKNEKEKCPKENKADNKDKKEN